jgi:hypothetical protein
LNREGAKDAEKEERRGKKEEESDSNLRSPSGAHKTPLSSLTIQLSSFIASINMTPPVILVW